MASMRSFEIRSEFSSVRMRASWSICRSFVFVVGLVGLVAARFIFRHVAACSGGRAFRSFLPACAGGAAGGFFFRGVVRGGHASIFVRPH